MGGGRTWEGSDCLVVTTHTGFQSMSRFGALLLKGRAGFSESINNTP